MAELLKVAMPLDDLEPSIASEVAVMSDETGFGRRWGGAAPL
jgi:hypothetical protein